MNEGGPRPASTFGRTVRSACLRTIRNRYPTWHIDRAEDGTVTAQRGDHDFREAGTLDMWAVLAITEQAERL